MRELLEFVRKGGFGIQKSVLGPTSYFQNTKGQTRLIENVYKINSIGKKFCSLEFFPSKKQSVDEQSSSICSSIKYCNGLFCAITWHLSDSETFKIEEIPAIKLSTSVMGTSTIDNSHRVLLHLAGTFLTKDSLMSVLLHVKQNGIRNIFVLRGDERENYDYTKSDFPHAVNIIKYIREKFGSYFTICVAGYPLGHPEAHSYEQDIIYLKQKVDAGADFIISQVIFKAEDFCRFVEDCQRMKISVPIIPSVMPIESYESLKRVSHLCKIKVPEDILELLNTLKDNDEMTRIYGCELLKDLIIKLLSFNYTPGIHFITLNRPELVAEICRSLSQCSNIIQDNVDEKHLS